MSVLDTEVDGSNPGSSMFSSWARHFIRIASVDSAVKWVPGGVNVVKDVQCYELFGGIAIKNHAFFIFMTGRNDDDLWSAGLSITSSNTSPKSHSETQATSRQSVASTKMWSELPLKAAHQNCLMADRRPLLQPNRHCQGRQELYWHNCAPVTAESLVSTWIESTRKHATIATTVVIRLMAPTTFLTAFRSRPHNSRIVMDGAVRNSETQQQQDIAQRFSLIKLTLLQFYYLRQSTIPDKLHNVQCAASRLIFKYGTHNYIYF